MDDAALLGLYLTDGNPDAIAVLYTRYAGKIRGYAAARLHGWDPEEAQDVVQSTWEAVLTYRRLSTRGSFSALVFHIAENLVRDHARWRVVRVQAREELARNGGKPLVWSGCTYCGGETKKGAQLCDAHAKRKSRGATDAEMRKPIVRDPVSRGRMNGKNRRNGK